MFFSQESNSTIYNHKCLFVRPSVCQQNPSTAWNHHPSSFILHSSSFFIHSSSSFIHPSFISRLLRFSACFIDNEKVKELILAIFLIISEVRFYILYLLNWSLIVNDMAVVSCIASSLPSLPSLPFYIEGRTISFASLFFFKYQTLNIYCLKDIWLVLTGLTILIVTSQTQIR